MYQKNNKITMKATELAKQAKIPLLQMKIALAEANRLNRIYAKEYLAYLRVKNNTPSPADLRRAKKEQALAAKLAERDKVNAVYDELYALTHYTQTIETNSTLCEIRRIKPSIAKLIKETVKEHSHDLPQSVYKRTKKTAPLQYTDLIAKLAYDPITGEITYNEGRKADMSAIHIANPPKKPPMQRLDLNRLPLCAKNKPPKHNGWLTYTTDAYALLDDDIRAQCIRRHYLERNPDKTSANATVRKTYYIRARVRSPSVQINNTSYLPQAIAYLYMGAGGRFDYSKGLDNPQRIAEEVTCEPYGMRNINIKTNKPVPYPCRDGNPLNYAWDNIKPDDLAVVLPTLTRAPRTYNLKERAVITRRITYSVERNIKVETTGATTTYTVHSMGRGNKTTLCHTWEDAVTVFNAQLKRIKGKHQTLRNGNVMVTEQVRQ